MKIREEARVENLSFVPAGVTRPRPLILRAGGTTPHVCRGNAGHSRPSRKSIFLHEPIFLSIFSFHFYVLTEDELHVGQVSHLSVI